MKLFYFLLAVGFIAGSLIEYLTTKKSDSAYYNLKDSRNCVLLMLTGLVADLIVKTGAIFLLFKLYNWSLFHFHFDWWTWIACYVVWDLIFYLKHYLEHNVRFMWAIHVNHHSSEYMNLSTSLRSGVLKSTYRYFFWAVVILIGFPVPMFLVIYGIGKIWAFFGHSQKLGHWGILERFTVTPSVHLLHHSYNEENLNKNFGETFLFWDKLFGTYKKPAGTFKFGIPEKVNHDNFGDVVFHEFRKMKKELKTTTGFREKLKIIFGKPPHHSPLETLVL
jgi:sterol desaturase/sphingolipid hydroxylase (fatty acid hydroxylase superfamily)